ncbi:sensor histidine kinase [Rhodovibrionaceae bacterium A322]
MISLLNRSDKPRRFAKQGRIYILGLLACAIVIYSIMLSYYFITGAKFIIGHDLRGFAEQFDEQLQVGNVIEPPSTWNTHVAFSYNDVPAAIRDYVDEDELRPSDLEFVDLEPEQIIPEAGDSQGEVFKAFLLRHPLHDGRSLYLTRMLKEGDLRTEEERFLDGMLLFIITPGLTFLILGIIAAHFFNRSLSTPILALNNWAQTLEIGDKANRSHPDFKFKELNKVADRLTEETSRLSDFIEREKNFLRHASHELRTPIAVIRGSLEILNKKGQSEDVMAVLGRMERANSNMQNLVETILWLNREDDSGPANARVNMVELVASVLEDHAHLLREKAVTIDTQYSKETILVPCKATPTRIIVSNLVRNALQHTLEGRVDISVTPQRLKVMSTENQERQSQELEEGLGLSLVRKIAEKMNWDLSLAVDAHKVSWTWRFPT